jgi:hypothetical protein
LGEARGIVTTASNATRFAIFFFPINFAVVTGNFTATVVGFSGLGSGTGVAVRGALCCEELFMDESGLARLRHGEPGGLRVRQRVVRADNARRITR